MSPSLKADRVLGESSLIQSVRERAGKVAFVCIVTFSVDKFRKVSRRCFQSTTGS